MIRVGRSGRSGRKPPRRSARLLPTHGGREWVVRIALALLLAVAGWWMLVQNVATAARRANPARAYALAPWDGRNASALAAMLAEADPLRRSGPDALARAALIREPMSPAAAAVLAGSAHAAGKRALGDRLFTYAEGLSRRELQTQLWAIESAVGRDDIVGALHHYDIVFRTNRRANELLFPVLASALTDQPIRAALTRTLLPRPLWKDDFLRFAASSRIEPAASAALFAELGARRVPVPADARARLTTVLIDRGERDLAWATFSALRPGADRQRSRDPFFAVAAVTEVPSALDWLPGSAPGVTASFRRVGSGTKVRGLLDFATAPSTGGALVEQRQLLPPGLYRLRGRSSGVDQPRDSLPFWVLRCQPGNRDLGRVPLGTGDNAAFDGTFVVPEDCPMQLLTLIAEAGNGLSGMTGQIEEALLEPAGR